MIGRMARPSKLLQRGAALLAAMLTVTLVASFAAAALWQQWRSVEVEAAERARVQAAWVLIGGLDWSRLILREDKRAGGADHLAEPWAVPLAEAKLTSFLAADKNIASDAMEGLPEAFLSGRIVDAQSKLNVLNLLRGGQPVPVEVKAFTRLFTLLSLPASELALMVSNLRSATAGSAARPASTGSTGAAAAGATGGSAAGSTTGSTTAGSASSTATATGAGVGAGSASAGEADGPLLPQLHSQLVWLGLSPATVEALEPYVTILPEPTPLNVNTASAEALHASLEGLDLAAAKQLVAQRTRSHFRGLTDANNALPTGSTVRFSEDARHTVASKYFDVRGRLRLERTWVEERSLVRRDDSLVVTTIWRERGAGTTAEPAKP